MDCMQGELLTSVYSIIGAKDSLELLRNISNRGCSESSPVVVLSALIDAANVLDEDGRSKRYSAFLRDVYAPQRNFILVLL